MRKRKYFFEATVSALAGMIVFIGCSQWDNLAGTRPVARRTAPAPYIAEKDMERLLRSIRPIKGNADGHYRLARHYQERDRHREAIKEFWKTVSIDPQYVDAFNGMGVSYDLLGDYPKAEIAYRLALKIEPDSDFTLNNLGYSCLLQGKFEEAARYLEEAVAKNGSNKRYRNNLGRAYFSIGRHRESLEQFSFSVGEANAHYIAGKLFYEEKMFQEAERHFAASLEMNPELKAAGKGVEASRAMIKIMGGQEGAPQPGPEDSVTAASQPGPGDETASVRGPEVESARGVVSPAAHAAAGSADTDTEAAGAEVESTPGISEKETAMAGSDDTEILTKPVVENAPGQVGAAARVSSLVGSVGKAAAAQDAPKVGMRVAGADGSRFSPGAKAGISGRGDRLRFLGSPRSMSPEVKALLGDKTHSATAAAAVSTGETRNGKVQAVVAAGKAAVRESSSKNLTAGFAALTVGELADSRSTKGFVEEKGASPSRDGAIVSMTVQAVSEDTGQDIATGDDEPSKKVTVTVDRAESVATTGALPTPAHAVASVEEPSAVPDEVGNAPEVLANRSDEEPGDTQIHRDVRTPEKAEDPFVLVRCHMKKENSRSVTVLQFMANSAYLESMQVQLVAGKGKEDLARSMAGYLMAQGYRKVTYLGEEKASRGRTSVHYSSEYLQPAFRIAKDIPGYQEMQSIGDGERSAAVVRIMVGDDMTAHAALFGNKEEYALSSR